MTEEILKVEIRKLLTDSPAVNENIYDNFEEVFNGLLILARKHGGEMFVQGHAKGRESVIREANILSCTN